MIEKFPINVKDSEIELLHNKIKLTRWPDEVNDSKWSHGTSLTFMQKVADYWEQILVINAHQRDRFSKKIIDCIEKNNLEPRVLLLGWAFKKDTNDTRESAAIYVSDNLINNSIRIDVYDPKVKKDQIDFDLSYLNENYDKSLVKFIEDPISNISSYSLIAIMTEWDEFKNYDWNKIYSKIKKPAFIFDGRNILEIKKIKKIGFNYIGLGRK